jgi:hypothetical protein
LPKRLLLIVAAFVAFAGVLAACGGKDKDDVISEADKICQEAQEDIDDIEADIEGTSDTGQIADSIRESEDRIDEAIDDLKALDVPDDGKDDWDEFIEKSEEQVGLAGDLADAVEANDSTRIQELGDQADEIEEEGDQAAEDYGLDDCAQDDDEDSSSGSGSTSTDDGTQPQSEVVTEANQACSDFQSEVEGLDQPTSPSEAGTYADRVSSELDQLISELNQLNPNAGQADYRQVLSTFEQQRDKLGELADAARDADQQRIEEIDSEIDELTQDGAEAAERFGIDECGSSGA